MTGHLVHQLSNGHLPANLSNSSTRQNGHFGKLVRLDTFARHLPTIFPGLDTFAQHSPTIFPGLDTFAKGEFGDFYTNLANLASVD